MHKDEYNDDEDIIDIKVRSQKEMFFLNTFPSHKFCQGIKVLSRIRGNLIEASECRNRSIDLTLHHMYINQSRLDKSKINIFVGRH